jgi:hypothetical protein
MTDAVELVELVGGPFDGERRTVDRSAPFLYMPRAVAEPRIEAVPAGTPARLEPLPVAIYWRQSFASGHGLARFVFAQFARH